MVDLISSVPRLRVRRLNAGVLRPGGEFVLYWMTANRRTRSNFALQRAAEWSRHMRLPLVVLSALRIDYPWATERTHAFMVDAMKDIADAAAGSNAVVHSYVEPARGAGRGLLDALSGRAAVVVTDDAPVFFLPTMSRTAAERIAVLVEGVDHNSLVPLAGTDRVFLRAYDLRRYLQKELPKHLDDVPADDPLADLPVAPPGLIGDVAERWPSSPPGREALAVLDLDRTAPALEQRGGQSTAHRKLEGFVTGKLERYEERNHPEDDVGSGLSPFLHFGNISPHEVFAAVADAEAWHPGRLANHASGTRSGWWGMSASAEQFLDQVVTWRELGYRAARYVPGNGTYAALPAWARATLETHAADARGHLYSFEELDAVETHDELWNAAQRQLRSEGTIHNYLRMLWGKKILEWTSHPEEAHEILFELNNRYALDGRDPNSVSGIHWVLGRYDRPWGPERAVFGTVRYMSSESARHKLRLGEYQSKMLKT